MTAKDGFKPKSPDQWRKHPKDWTKKQRIKHAQNLSGAYRNKRQQPSMPVFGKSLEQEDPT